MHQVLVEDPEQHDGSRAFSTFVGWPHPNFQSSVPFTAAKLVAMQRLDVAPVPELDALIKTMILHFHPLSTLSGSEVTSEAAQKL